jgi:hypothetical protein
MVAQTTYVFSTSMDVDPDKEALFNEVYDDEHVPLLSKVPGVISVTRFTTEPLTISMAGERKTIDVASEPKYTAVYEIESPDVLTSEAWAEAVDKGRWATEVRPYTSNRRMLLKKVIRSSG